jgi:integrase
MGRKRIHDTHLPKRVYLRRGVYYFVDYLGKWHSLGKTMSVMYMNLSHLVEGSPVRSMNDLFERYEIEVIPTKAPRTQKDNTREIKLLRAVLGEMAPRQFLPRHGYAYYNERKKTSHHRAVNEMALLSHVFTKAVEWGVSDSNPCREIRKQRPKPRQRYVSDSEYQAAYRVMPPMVQCAMDLAVLTSLRPADLLGLERSNLTEEGIRIDTRKTGKRLIIQWSDELRAVVKRALALPPHIRQPLISTRRGRPYTVSGWNSIWYRRMKKSVADKKNALTESFQFRDLRAKSASDDTAESATARLGHNDPRLTEKTYRRKPAVVHPLR